MDACSGLRECLDSPAHAVAEFSCAVCNTPFTNAWPLDAKGVCAMCRSGLRGFDRAASFGAYEGALRELIHLYKYSGDEATRAASGFRI